MKVRNLILVPAAVTAVVLVLVARVMTAPDGPATTPEPAGQSAAKSLQPEVLSNPTDQPALAEGAGKDAFISSCLNCHSARYITMQPRFSRKVWTAEVAKMVKAYKASIAPEQQAQIVDYLVAGYGAEAKQPDAK